MNPLKLKIIQTTYQVIYFFLIAVFSCSEPIDFVLDDVTLLVVDAQVSSVNDETYVLVFEHITEYQEIRKAAVSGLFVYLESGSGVIVPFKEVDPDRRGFYTPVNRNFVGQYGQSYKLIAEMGDNYSISSDFDILHEPSDFGFAVEKNTGKVLTPSNSLVDVPLFEAIVDVEPTDTYYSRFTFRYEYLHYWYQSNLVERNNDEYSLYQCSSNESCQNENRIVVGSEFDRNWRFSLPGCGENCPTACCITFEDYDTQFIVRQEALSLEAYIYWEKVEQLLNNEGLVFDTPPFTINGNLSCNNCPFPVVGQLRSVGVIEKSKRVVL